MQAAQNKHITNIVCKCYFVALQISLIHIANYKNNETKIACHFF